MRRFPNTRRVAVLAALLWLALSAAVAAADLYQVGTIQSLSAGDYAGRETFAALSRHGDFGLGTFFDLDGEMVALDGAFYQVTSDGVVHPVPPGRETPFAQVAFFKGSLDLGRVDGLTLSGIGQALIDRMPDPSRFYVVRVEGLFATATIRSVPAQKQPWPPLAAAVKEQAVFPLENIQGTLVGIYSPPGTGALSPEGWHFHFLSADRRRGGHVLAARAVVGKVRGDRIESLIVVFPRGATPRGPVDRPPAGAE